MPKRNRAGELKRNDGKLADHQEPEKLTDDHGIVTDTDLADLERYCSWTGSYIDAVQAAIAEHRDTRKPRSDEWIIWNPIRREHKDDVRLDAHGSWQIPPDNNKPVGFRLRLRADMDTGEAEHLDLMFDANYVVTSGLYRFYRHNSETPRPAPDVSTHVAIPELHAAGTSRRCARILMLFKAATMESPDQPVIPVTTNWSGSSFDFKIPTPQLPETTEF